MSNLNYKDKIKKSFNKGAKNYEEYNILQKNISKKLINFYIKTNKLNKHISLKNDGLDLGCGNGLMSCQFLKFENFKKLNLIDISKNMICLAKKKINLKNTIFEISDFEAFSDFKNFNLIFSNMSLHWSLEFNTFFFKLVESMKDNSVFIFSTPKNFIIKKSSSENLFKNFINEFPDIEQCLSKLNHKYFFNYKVETIEEEFDNILSFFKKLKKIGANTQLKKKNINLYKLRTDRSKIIVKYKINLVYIKKLGI